jgi:hypothetical protein
MGLAIYNLKLQSMNWMHFSLCLVAVYSLYYLIVIASDMMRAGKHAVTASISNELTFTEYQNPVQLASATVIPEPLPVKAEQSNDMIASGGVPITDLFRLAKQEAIIYTRSVSF